MKWNEFGDYLPFFFLIVCFAFGSTFIKSTSRHVSIVRCARRDCMHSTVYKMTRFGNYSIEGKRQEARGNHNFSFLCRDISLIRCVFGIVIYLCCHFHRISYSCLLIKCDRIKTRNQMNGGNKSFAFVLIQSHVICSFSSSKQKKQNNKKIMFFVLCIFIFIFVHSACLQTHYIFCFLWQFFLHLFSLNSSNATWKLWNQIEA